MTFSAAVYTAARCTILFPVIRCLTSRRGAGAAATQHGEAPTTVLVGEPDDGDDGVAPSAAVPRATGGLRLVLVSLVDERRVACRQRSRRSFTSSFTVDLVLMGRWRPSLNFCRLDPQARPSRLLSRGPRTVQSLGLAENDLSSEYDLCAACDSSAESRPRAVALVDVPIGEEYLNIFSFCQGYRKFPSEFKPRSSRLL